MVTSPRSQLLCVAMLTLATACAEVSAQGDGGPPGTGSGGTGAPPLDDGGAGVGVGSLTDALGAPPADFTMTKFGGYKLGLKLASSASSDPATGPRACNALVGVVRDFKGA